jgi:hypothetical protein
MGRLSTAVASLTNRLIWNLDRRSGWAAAIVLRYQEATDAFIPPTLPDADEEAEAPLLLDLPDEPETEPSPLIVDSEDQAEPDEADDDDWTVTEPTFEDIEA